MFATTFQMTAGLIILMLKQTSTRLLQEGIDKSMKFAIPEVFQKDILKTMLYYHDVGVIFALIILS